ncbi:polyhydroxyalkanoic acid system family protein [Hydrocarboniphaga sp.]|uniref:polyhydroxyalkanoic acid system family protein n=1 Tax=Hydrocarboniphaga sp. TaxID=2033016 RepID=UPI003D0C7BB6
MADIDITRAHGKSVAETKKIVDALIGKMAKDFDLKHNWEGDTLKFERSGLSGQMAITEQDLHITAKLGMLLKPMKGRIEKELTAALDRKLA